MPVPNSITHVVNKEGMVVPFDISKIHNAISKAIMSIEHADKWEAENRALKYAEMVKNRIYQKFYDLNWQISEFIRTLSGFEKEEMQQRIKDARFASRLTNLLLIHYFARYSTDKIDLNHKDKVYEFIKSTISTKIPSELTYLTDVISETFVNKLIEKSNEGLSSEDHFPCRDFIQDSIEEQLKEIGEIYIAEGFMIFREGKRKLKSKELTLSQFTSDGIHRDMLRKTLLWNIEHECDSVFSLNDWVLGKGNKSFKELVRLSDERFYNDLNNIVEQIVARKDDLKVVIIAGPSCSNKTTITNLIGRGLKEKNVRLKELNIDDYFFDLSKQPKDAFGDYDYEMPEAIDIELLNKNLADLMEGRSTMKPKYDFKTGQRSGLVPFSVEKGDIILIDCLHGLYQKLTQSVPSTAKFKVYTESMNLLRNTDGSYTKWTDIRLCKRMIRDAKYRKYDASKTLAHWAYVRKGELKHIIPYIYSVDAVINSGLPYELPILKATLSNDFPTIEYIEKLRMQGRLDAYIRGMRISTLFDTIISYPDESVVPGTSPIREFIGGSIYEIAHNE